MLSRLLLAFEFLTIVRFRRAATFDREAFARSQAAYAVAGLALGAAVAGIWLAAGWALPRPPSTALAVVALVVLTGALHLDGLADTFDGMLGGRARESRLAIMRDPRIGSFGAVAVAALLLLKWSALLGMEERGAIVAALLAAPAVARGALVMAIAAYPYAREGDRPAGAEPGMGAGFHAAARGPAGVIAVASAVAIATAIYGGAGAAIAAGVIVGGVVIAWWPYTRLGGLTGDTYGALVEVLETGALLAIAAGAEGGWLHPWLWEG